MVAIIEHMCYYARIYQGEAMRLLRIALEKRRWDLAACTIVLSTASVLKNGDKPHVGTRVSDNTSGGTSGGSGIGRAVKNEGREFAGQERRAQRQSER